MLNSSIGLLGLHGDIDQKAISKIESYNFDTKLPVLHVPLKQKG